jgi:hypothetical protein
MRIAAIMLSIVLLVVSGCSDNEQNQGTDGEGGAGLLLTNTVLVFKRSSPDEGLLVSKACEKQVGMRPFLVVESYSMRKSDIPPHVAFLQATNQTGRIWRGHAYQRGNLLEYAYVFNSSHDSVYEFNGISAVDRPLLLDGPFSDGEILGIIKALLAYADGGCLCEATLLWLSKPLIASNPRTEQADCIVRGEMGARFAEYYLKKNWRGWTVYSMGSGIR